MMTIGIGTSLHTTKGPRRATYLVWDYGVDSKSYMQILGRVYRNPIPYIIKLTPEQTKKYKEAFKHFAKKD